MSIVLQSSGGGSVTLQEPATASNFTVTVPAITGTAVVTGTTPTLNGITFPATAVPSADANTLDDYEEGTWTPTISAQSGSYTTVISQSGSYTKIGRQVTISWFFTVSNKGTGSVGASITNLPFASNWTSGTNYYAGSGTNASTNVAQACAFQNPSLIYLQKFDGTDPIVASYSNFGTLTYFTS